MEIELPRLVPAYSRRLVKSGAATRLLPPKKKRFRPSSPRK
jgi:hypothetical protein